MEIKIMDWNDGSLLFTTDSPASHYGIPVVRHEGCSLCTHDFGPGDEVPECLENVESQKAFGTTPNMAAFVAERIWEKIRHGDGSELREVAEKWFAQMPSGPQIVRNENGGPEGGPFWEII